MNYYDNFSEPYRARLILAMQERDQAESGRYKSRANAAIRSIRLAHARSKGTHTPDQWLNLVASMQFRCVMCGSDLGDRPQKDHITPIYQGGSDGIENLQPLCVPCNASKGPDTTNWVEYREANGFEI